MRKLYAVLTSGALLAGCVLANTVSSSTAGAAVHGGGTGSVVFDDAPGTSAPPRTLGSHVMTPFGSDDPSVGSDVNAAPDGALGFSPALADDQVGNGWNTWSNGYTGDVYATASGSIVLTLPPGTSAFYFYAEPVQYQVLTITATNSDGTTSGAIPVQGQGGAEYFGFYSTDSTPLTSVTVSTADPDGFAVGEFGVAQGFSVKGSLKVMPSTSQSEHTKGEVCKTAKFVKYKAEGYAIAAAFNVATYTNAGSLLRHFLSGLGTPVNFPNDSKLSKQLLENPNFQSMNKAVQNAIAAQLKAGKTEITLTKPPLDRIGLYTPGDLHWSFGGTQGTDLTGSGKLVGDKFEVTLTYTIMDSYGFSVNDIFYQGVGQDMRYLQTNCGNREGGARWFPDSVKATVDFSLPVE
jgi:hypothetical protein